MIDLVHEQMLTLRTPVEVLCLDVLEAFLAVPQRPSEVESSDRLDDPYADQYRRYVTENDPEFDIGARVDKVLWSHRDALPGSTYATLSVSTSVNSGLSNAARWPMPYGVDRPWNAAFAVR